MATDVGIRVGVDGAAEFKNALKGIDAQLKNLDSEMKSTVSGSRFPRRCSGRRRKTNGNPRKTDFCHGAENIYHIRGI